MSHELAAPQDPSIEEVQRQFEAWREKRQLHEPIPAKLWKAAASLCGTVRPYIIARKLGLNYTKLKQHVHATKANPPIQEISTAAFVQLDFHIPSTACQCSIEMQDSRGGKTTVRFDGVNCPDPIEICKAFWSRNS